MIFARDRALCAYSGKSLWLADFGAAPSSLDWIDHIVPVRRGGKPTLENGVSASALYNWVKRDHQRGVVLFKHGLPTEDFYTYHHTLSEGLAEHIRRFRLLHSSDWYFNRALGMALLATTSKSARRIDGLPFKRDSKYYSSACLSFLEKWRKHSVGVPPLKERGLLPAKPAVDQRLLLDVTAQSSATGVKRLCAQLSPYVQASWAALELFGEAKHAIDARVYAKAILSHQYVSPLVKASVRRNLALLEFPSDGA